MLDAQLEEFGVALVSHLDAGTLEFGSSDVAGEAGGVKLNG